MKKLIAVVAVVASVLVIAAASADARVVVGTRVYIGPYWGPYWGPGPYWYPPYYYPPAYYPPPAPYPTPLVTEPQSFIQQAPFEGTPAAESVSYWYYCEGAKAYYPYVRECPGGWLEVVPPVAPEPRQ